MSNGNGGGNGFGAQHLGEVAAAATAFIGLITGLAVTGVLQQTQRDHGVWLLAAFACVLAGASAWLGATLWKEEIWRKRFRGAGVILFAIGLALAVVAVLKTQEEAERPAVSASFDSKTGVLTASTTAKGLTPDKRVLIVVDGLIYKPHGGIDASNIYFGVVGPNPDGDVKEPLRVTVPPGRFDALGVRAWTGKTNEGCDYQKEIKVAVKGVAVTKQNNLPGCLIVRIPHAPDRPTVTAQWERGTRNVLVLHFGTTNTWQLTSVRAVGLRGSRRSDLGIWFGDPGPDGSLDASSRIPVGSSVRLVCIEGRFEKSASKVPAPQCPVRRNTPWATRIELAVPQYIVSGEDRP